MGKLSKAEIEEKAEQWAQLQLKIAKLAKAEADELAPFDVAYAKKTQPINEKYQKKFSSLMNQAEPLRTEIIEWLEGQKKSVTVESTSAIASFFKGKKAGTGRVANVKSFLGFVKSKGEEVYKCMTVVLKDAEKLIGKTELDKICTKPDKDVAEATLELK